MNALHILNFIHVLYILIFDIMDIHVYRWIEREIIYIYTYV